jgi:adenine deaminase
MDFEAVLRGEEKFMRILELGWRKDVVIDGHCVLLSGARLNAYIAAGPEADHENFTVESMLEKLRRGMYVKLRGPYILDTKRFVEALKSVPSGWNRVIFVTDDVMPDTLLEKGHLDFVIRSMIEAGIDEVEAIRSATLRPAEHMRMREIGAIAPGRIADVVVLKDLRRVEVDLVVSNGVPVAKEGKMIVNHKSQQQQGQRCHALSARLSIFDIGFCFIKGIQSLRSCSGARPALLNCCGHVRALDRAAHAPHLTSLWWSLSNVHRGPPRDRDGRGSLFHASRWP